MSLAVLLWLAMGLPAGAAYFRRRRFSLGLAVLPLAGSLALLGPWIISAYTGLRTGGAWWGLEAAVFGLILGAIAELVLRSGKSPAPAIAEATRPAVSPVRIFVGGAFVLALAIWNIDTGLSFMTVWPPFQWDGYATWLTVTKIIADCDSFPRHLFVPGGQWEYPILMPTLLAWFRRTGELGIHDSTLSLSIIAAVLPLAAWSALWRKLGPTWAAAAVSSPLIVPQLLFWHYGAYADGMLVMLDIYALLLAMVGIRDNDRGYLLAGGMGFAAAVMTKNEGALWVLSSGIFLGFYALEHKARVLDAVKKIALCTAPAAVFFFSWWGVCKMLGLSNDVIANGKLLGNGGDTGKRIGIILDGFGQVFTFGTCSFGENSDRFDRFWQHTPLPLIIPALILIPLLARGSIRRRLVRLAVLMSGPVVFTLGMMSIYLVTPKPLEWHLGTSLNRVMMVVFAAIFSMIFFARSKPQLPALPNP